MRISLLSAGIEKEEIVSKCISNVNKHSEQCDIYVKPTVYVLQNVCAVCTLCTLLPILSPILA